MLRSKMPVIVALAILVSGYPAAQTSSKDEREPAFSFTPSHGTPSTGHFSPSGQVSFIDQFEGTASAIDFRNVERIEVGPRKAEDHSKCAGSPRVVITFSDGTKQHGCFAPGPLAFIGEPGSIPSVNAVSGKFVRVKQKR